MELWADAQYIFNGAIAAADPRRAVERHVRREGDVLLAGKHEYDLTKYKRIRVLAAGKAAGPMSQAIEDLLGDNLTAGLGVVKEGHSVETRRIKLLEAAHPMPDKRGLEATAQMLGMLMDSREDDLVIMLLSGGASALLESLPEVVTLNQMRQVTAVMLRSGASIGELNTVRRALSRVKGGRLLLAAAPSQVLTLVLSDVLGSPFDQIGSGPMYPMAPRAELALDILERRRIRSNVPPTILFALEQAARDEPDLAWRLRGRADAVRHVLLGDNSLLANDAVRLARERGYKTLLLTTWVQGEAREAGRFMAAIAREVREGGQPLRAPAAIVASGETTVTVRGDGNGGRNQETALGFAMDAAGLPNLVFAAVASDGTDGPTDAAGARADGSTIERARDKGVSPQATLDANDSYTFFQTLDDLIVTGPTGTNVNDLLLLLIA